jgi:transcriptional regulator with XRE-family HTH domain
MRAGPTSKRLTLEDAIEIHRRRWLRKEAQHVLAAGFGVTQGRISEVLSGKAFPEAKTLALLGRLA